MTARLAMAGAVAAAALVAGCGSDETERVANTVALENVSVGTARDKAQGAMKLRPGQWEITIDMGKLDLPGAPPEVARAVGEAVTKNSRRITHCLTQEEADRPPADIVAGGSSDQCRYESFSMVGGRMDGTMVCNGQDRPGETRMTMAGTYSPVQYAVDMDMKITAPPGIGVGTMTMTAKTSGRRVGECTPGGPA